VKIQTTKYYDEFLRYHEMAKKQQELCNLGLTPHHESGVDDPLMEHVHLYDVVERKYAGFSQIINDVFYGYSKQHPYWFQIEADKASPQRMEITRSWSGKRRDFTVAAWLYVFIVHRVTGSGINYARKPSGYNNTILPKLAEARSIGDMADIIFKHQDWAKSPPIYTSVGYQFPAFPKPKEGYKRGGDYFLCEYAPRLAKELEAYLFSSYGRKRTLREVGDFMLNWNVANGLRQYKFQYAAVVADIADWFPQFVDRTSPFYYGSNAVECINYLAKPASSNGRRNTEFLDEVMAKAASDTGGVPYNLEDVACDFIRWVENYVRPGADYDHVDRDKVFSSCRIKDHPYGRQKAMLDLGLVKSFNEISVHPSDDYVISRAKLHPDQYRMKVEEFEQDLAAIRNSMMGKDL